MSVKTEPQQDVEKVKADIMELVAAHEDGLSELELSRTMLSTPGDLRMKAINALTDEGKIQLCKRGPDLIYRAIESKFSASHSAALKSTATSIEERAVFQVVHSAGSKGIWNREIRNLTKLPLNQMGKVLKNLEAKKLIKAVKSVTASKKKLYMLYDLEPDKSVTGGAWYSGTEFESEYVQILHEQCYQFVKRRSTPTTDVEDFVDFRNKSLVSSVEVKAYIDELKISNVKLTLQDIEMVLETIVFDGLIEKITNVTGVESKMTASSSSLDHEEACYYRALNKMIESSGINKAPCGQCSYVHECRPGAVINPESCKYFERWLNDQ